jgi:hypothetical protein
MYRLSYVVLFLVIQVSGLAQNPHGKTFAIDCKACHTSDGWNIDISVFKFNHDTTGYILEGQHRVIECNACHRSLQFENTPGSCMDCHTDVHSMSVGNDCSRCHNPTNWLVDNIPELHEQNGFPLTGAHDALMCMDCHTSETTLRWDPIGNDCAECHFEDYTNSVNPNHLAAGFSTNCIECHEPISMEWGSENFHFFFPMTLGHDVRDCNECHSGNNYSNVSPECVSCHLQDFNHTANPDHRASGFSTDCSLCHTTDPGWSPADFTQHDSEYFPIYSGKHQGEWNACTECHISPNNFMSFSCIDCHEHNNAADMADKHEDEQGYVFQSTACYNCHPRGEEDD